MRRITAGWSIVANTTIRPPQRCESEDRQGTHPKPPPRPFLSGDAGDGVCYSRPACGEPWSCSSFPAVSPARATAPACMAVAYRRPAAMVSAMNRPVRRPVTERFLVRPCP